MMTFLKNYFIIVKIFILTGPWWSSGLERHSIILVMLKVEGSNSGHPEKVIFQYAETRTTSRTTCAKNLNFRKGREGEFAVLSFAGSHRI